MSISSPTEKIREDSEDSGHDSVDSLHVSSDVDDRERIAHLETAVSWIRQEVVSVWSV